MDAKLVVPFETIDLLRQLAKKLHRQGDISDALTLAAAVADVVQTSGAPAFYADTFFGGCPSCGDCEEVLAIDGKRYGACHEHRVYWCIGRDFLTWAVTQVGVRGRIHVYSLHIVKHRQWKRSPRMLVLVAALP